MRVVLLALVCVVGACKKEGGNAKKATPISAVSKAQKDKNRQVVENAKVPAWFAQIPMDTPYLVASILPVSERELETMISWTESGIAAECDMMKNMGSSSQFGPEIALMQSVCDNWNLEGLKSLGVGSNVSLAIYGLGYMPVFRVSLESPDKLIAKVDAVIKTLGGAGKVAKTVDGKNTYWAIDEDGMAIVFGIFDGHFAGALASSASKSHLIAHLAGKQSPKNSMTGGKKLKEVATKYGFLPSYVGYVDVVALADFAGPGTSQGHILNQALLGTTLGDECKKTLAKQAQRTPRLVLGMDRMTPKVQEQRMIVEMSADLVKGLRDIELEGPAFDMAAHKDALLAGSWSVGKDAVNDILSRWHSLSKEISKSCDIDGLADGIEEIQSAMAMSPDFGGGLLYVEKFSMSNLKPDMAGYGGIFMDSPGALLGLMGQKADGNFHSIDPMMSDFKVAASDKAMMFVADSKYESTVKSAFAKQQKSEVWFQMVGDSRRIEELGNSLNNMFGTSNSQPATPKYEETVKAWMNLEDYGMEMRAITERK